MKASALVEAIIDTGMRALPTTITPVTNRARRSFRSALAFVLWIVVSHALRAVSPEDDCSGAPLVPLGTFLV
jgi:hypothetical protein